MSVMVVLVWLAEDCPFTCDGHLCLRKEKLCDKHFDCQDQADERQALCQLEARQTVAASGDLGECHSASHPPAASPHSSHPPALSPLTRLIHPLSSTHSTLPPALSPHLSYPPAHSTLPSAHSTHPPALFHSLYPSPASHPSTISFHHR